MLVFGSKKEEPVVQGYFILNVAMKERQEIGIAGRDTKSKRSKI